MPLVDVLVGGQYGSEGKGNILGHIAPEYDLFVRVGGPNAGHQVYAEPQPEAYFQSHPVLGVHRMRNFCSGLVRYSIRRNCGRNLQRITSELSVSRSIRRR